MLQRKSTSCSRKLLSMRKIKVLHIIYSFGIGGLEKGIAMLINNASDQFEHSILCLTESGDSRYLLKKDVSIIEMNKPPGNSINFIFKLAKKIKELKPDVVHTRNWSGIDGILAARLSGCKTVVHGEHGWGMEDSHGQHPKRKFVRRWLSLLVKEFTAVSKQIEDWLRDDIRVFKPVTQIYNGVSFVSSVVEQNQGWLHRELKVPETAPLIGTVGRLDPIKDQLGLIEAFSLLRESVHDAQLLIVGDGLLRTEIESKKVAGVHLLGMRNDVPEILQSLDIFALPSLNEGISNTILEAMAAGLPIVATSVGGTPELIEHESNGLLVESGDYFNLAEAMKRYLESADLRNLHGRESQRIIEEKFSIKAMVLGYENIWERVL